MKILIKSIVLFVFLLVGLSTYAQGYNLDDPNLILKDDKGNTQTKQWVYELIKKGSVSMTSKENADGKTEITFNLISEKEVEENKKRVSDGIEKLKNTKFPDFILSTVDGKKLSNKDLEGKIVVFNFWFTTCGPCITEMPELNKIAEKYKDNKSVMFIAPSFEENELIKKFLKRKTFDFKIVTGSKELNKKLGILSYPVTIITDKKGIIKEVIYSGENIFEKIDKYLQNNI